MARKQDRMDGYAKQHRAHRRWGLLVRTAAVAVALCTTSALVLPALTMEAEKAAYCGNQAHTHSAQCYTKRCVCGLEEVTQPALVCTVPEGHTHTDACREKTLTCTVAEGHTHAPECYQTVEELTCTLPEDANHTHTEGCYARHEQLVCTLPEGHVHTEECYEQHLVCTLPENHTHTDGCYAPVSSDAHTHTEACYRQELTCPLPEHTHTLACYSDPTADKETSADWEATLPAEKTGVWAWDLVAAAQSQLGYAESEKNYEVQPDGVTTLGYTRYGDWYGIPYGDWCAMFVSFCLNYAGVPRESMPIESSVPRWAQMLAEQGQLYSRSDRDPRPGDLMFLDGDGDEAPEHMGIVETYGEDLVVIEGNTSSNVVERVTYRRDTDLAMVFAPCPVNPEDLTTASFEGENFSVQAVYSSEAGIPADAQLRASEYPADSETYRRRVEQMQAQYGLTPEESEKIRLFNIGFYQGDAEVEPSAPVEVTLTYADRTREVGCSVAHFGAELEQIPADATVANGMRTLRFTLGSFSDVAVMPLAEAQADGKFALVSRNRLSQGDHVGSHVALMPTQLDNGHLGGAFISAMFESSAGGQFPNYAVVFGSEAEVTEFKNNQMIWNLTRSGWLDYYYYKVYANVNGEPHYLQVDESNLTTTTSSTNATEFNINVVSGFIMLKVRNQNRYINKSGHKDAKFGTYHVENDQNNHFYLVSDARAVGTVRGETPPGTDINLFDYWVTKEDESGPPTDANGGINRGHGLHFTYRGERSEGDINHWTGQDSGKTGGVLQRIVQNRKGEDGYPILSHNGESLDYLFDPTRKDPTVRREYVNVGNLLQVDEEGYFYYDSKKNFAQFDQNKNQFILYENPRVNPGMFFPFDRYEDLKWETNPDFGTGHGLNHYFGLTLTTRFINRAGGYADSHMKKPMTFEFSGDDDVWIFIDGILAADLGGIHDAANVKIDFQKGTVTISRVYDPNGSAPQERTFAEIFCGENAPPLQDGRLKDNSSHTLEFYYLERGGAKSNMYLKYNLTSIPTTGVYKADQYGDPIPGAKFAVYAAQKDPSGEYQYLDQLGGSVVNRGDFQFPAYDADGNIIGKDGKVLVKALYTGTTNAGGEMIFQDEFGGALTIEDLQGKFGTHFLLREIGVPDGYRRVDVESCMYIQDGALLTEDTYNSGVYNAAAELITAPGTIYLMEQDEHNYTAEKVNHYDANGKIVDVSDVGTSYGEVSYYHDVNTNEGIQTKINGTLFAVVQKFSVGADATWAEILDNHNWKAIYGSGDQGYQEVGHNGSRGGLLEASITAAKAQQQEIYHNGSVFTPAASGAMELEMRNLPGQLQEYYWYLVNNEHLNAADPADQQKLAQKTRFTVALFWTTGKLENADVNNTWQVSIDIYPIGKLMKSGRAFGATIEIPNIANRMILQKLDREGNGVNDATFALYPAGTAKEASQAKQTLYYLDETNTSKIVLNEDGTARLLDSAERGTYTIDPGSGHIAVTIGGSTYGIAPQRGYDNRPIIKTTAPNAQIREQDGVLDLMGMPNGNFVLREIKAPAGYLINPAQIMVQVDDQGICINAGVEHDGVTVSLGPGTLVGSMKHLASAGNVDRTLHWIYSVMKSNAAQADTFQFSTDPVGGANHWKYLDQDGKILEATDVKDAVEKGAMRSYMSYVENPKNLQNYVINDRRLNSDAPGVMKDHLLKADEGWTDLVIRQDYDFGSTQKKEDVSRGMGGYNYDDLQNKPISKLFSLAKLVQVTDQRTSSLSIAKQVVNPQQDTPAFQFDITLTTGKDGKSPVVGTFPMTRTAANGVTEETITFTDGKAQIFLRDGEKVMIDHLPEGADYTVTEVEDPSYAPSHTIDGGNPTPGNTATGTLVWNADPLDYTTDLVFTNTYQTTVTLVKHDISNQTTLLPGAKFTLQNEQKLYYQPNGGFDAAKAELTTDDAGQIRFANLADGKYTLTETKAPDGYARLTHPVEITVTGAKITAVNFGGAQYKPTISPDGLTLYLPNGAGMVLPQTGGVGTTGITTLGLGLLILAGAVLLYQKRKGAVSKS